MDLRRSLRPLAALGVAVVAASGCAIGAVTPSGAPAPTPTVTASPAQVAERVGALVPEPPSAIGLPDGRRVTIRAVGTTRNGLLDVPTDIRVAGWWTGGSRLGDPFGSTLVAAHVDSRTQGLGPFASLLTARPGDRVVLRSDGLRQAFRITTRRLRPQGTISAGSWLHSPAGPRRLTLVTCAGPYDAARGGYQNLAVIVAEPVGEPVPRR